jgi:hypothetical protein
MNGRIFRSVLSLFILGTLLSSAPIAANDTAAPQQACVGWDLTYANWLYRASAGGYGTISLTQDANGLLTGSYWNEAAQGGGTLTGHVEGTSLGRRPASGCRVPCRPVAPTSVARWKT